MDVNGMPIEGFYSTNLPAGLGAAPPLSAALQMPVAENETSGELRVTDSIAESEMEHIILAYKAARSAEEAKAVLEKNVPEDQMGRVLDGLESDLFS